LRPRWRSSLRCGGERADATGATEAVEQARGIGKGQLADGQAEDVVVEEGQRGVGRFEAVHFRLGDVFEESADVPEGEVAGMALVVEEDQSA